MSDKPIIFSAPMVRALLDGRKTQTRRVLKISGHRTFSQFGPSDTNGYDWHFRDAGARWHDYRHADLLARLPYAVSDRLWLREAHAIREAIRMPRRIDNIEYRADLPGEAPPMTDPISSARLLWNLQPKRWRPSIHMPRWASRITLTVTDVRVQRLQDISEADARAEGAVMPWLGSPGTAEDDTRTGLSEFEALWNSLHGPDAWDQNPWVVALTFTVQKGNIDV